VIGCPYRDRAPLVCLQPLIPVSVEQLPGHLDESGHSLPVADWEPVRRQFARDGGYRYMALGEDRRLIAGGASVDAVRRWLIDVTGLQWDGKEWARSTTPEDVREVTRRVIYERATMRPVGGVNLHAIDHRHRTAELGIYVGETDCWGKGYGTEATMLVLDYGFNALGLHNIMLRVFSHNPRAIRAYEKAGFRVIGRRREAHRHGGEVHDDIYMDCLSTEFASPVLRQMPGPPGKGP